MAASQTSTPRAYHKRLHVQVLIAIVLGIALGIFNPPLAQQMKPLGDGFIKLIRMMIVPIVFCTVVSGIASIGDMRRVGRVGMKALIYFEVVTTLALVIGLVMVTWIKPGAGRIVRWYGSTMTAWRARMEASKNGGPVKGIV